MLVWAIGPLYRGTGHIFWAFGSGFGVVLEELVLSAPAAQCRGCSLDNRAIHLRHRTIGFAGSFLFRPADPSWLGAGGDLGILATLAVARDCVTSFVLLFGDLISPRPSR